MKFATYVTFVASTFLVCANSYAYPGNSAAKAGTLAQSRAFFIENKGQLIDQYHHAVPDIDFKLRRNGMNVFVSRGKLYYQFTKVDSVVNIPGMEGLLPGNRNLPDVQKKGVVTINRLTMCLVNANLNAEVIKEEQVGYHENYFLPQCPNGVKANAYGKIIYKNIYPNIDWVLYIKDGGLKYDFVVHEEGRVDDIQMEYEDGVSLQNGNIVANVALGTLTESAPYSYELISGKKISSHFKLTGKIVGIECDEHNGGIVIDPQVLWSSYYGGLYDDYCYALTQRYHSDFTKAYTYMAGTTNSFENMVVVGSGSYREFHAGGYMDGNMDGFIAAFTGAPQSPSWATYFGGEGHDIIKGIVCDKVGNVYIGGATSSDTGIATPGSHQLVSGGETLYLPGRYKDGFISKLDTNGFRIWSTYYGGERWDQVNAMAIDSGANIYATGHTFSTVGIATTHQLTNPYYTETAFLVKFDSAGHRLWGTFYGGDLYTEGRAVTCDPQGNVYMVGGTSTLYDSAKIAPTGNYQTHLGGSCNPPGPSPDGFAAKFDKNGVRQWGTYYGGSCDDYINAIVFDSTKFIDSSGTLVDGLVYFAGSTLSSNSIASFGGYLSTASSGFIAAFTTNGKRYWGTYSGEVNALTMNKGGHLLVCGNGVYAAAYYQAAQQWVTSFGGGAGTINIGTSIAANTDNTFMVGGYTTSTTGIADYGTGTSLPQANFAGYTDAFLRKFSDDPVIPLRFAGCCMTCSNPGQFCIGETAIVYLNQGSNMTIQLSDSTGDFSHPIKIGSGVNPCGVAVKIPDTIKPGTNYYLRAISSKPLMISETYGPVVVQKAAGHISITSNSPLCVGDTLNLKLTDSNLISNTVYAWFGPDTNMFDKEPVRHDVQLTAAGTYNVIVNNGACVYTDSLHVIVNPVPAIHGVKNNSPICTGDSLTLTVTDTTSGLSYNWAGPNNFISSLKNPVIEKIPMVNAGKYVLTYAKLGCFNKDSTNVILNPSPAKPTASSNSPVCDGDTLKLIGDNIVTGVSYIWTGPQGYYTQLQTPLRLASVDVGGIYYVRSKLYDCTSDADSVKVVVKPLPPIPKLTSNSPLKEGSDLMLTASDIAGAVYTWQGPNGFSSSEQNPVIKKVTPTATGNYTVLVNLDGCYSSGIIIVVINEVAQTYFSLFPNPNKGIFKIKITLEKDQHVPLEVLNEAGQEVYREDVNSDKKLIEHAIELPGSLANGVYFLKIRMDGNNRIIPFVLDK
jgi:hypothetical protein